MNQTVINQVFPGNCPASCDGLVPQIAKNNSIPTIDQFDALGGKGLTCQECYYNTSQPGCACDGCHPDDNGYVKMANAVYTVIHKLMF